jgi:hypothetical protein
MEWDNQLCDDQWDAGNGVGITISAERLPLRTNRRHTGEFQINTHNSQNLMKMSHFSAMNLS